MSKTYRFAIKNNGYLYDTWVTKRKYGKSQTQRKSTGLGRLAADITARTIVGAIKASDRPVYRLCKDPAEALRKRQEAERQLSRELDIPQNNTFGGTKMDSLDRKVVDVFPGKVVRKDLTTLMKKGANVPTYVLEYLLGMYCATDDEEAIEVGLGKIKRILSENYVRPDQSEYVKSKIKENGQYTVIDKITVTFDDREDKYVARFTNLRMDPFEVPSDLVVHNEKLLIGGIWCIVKIEYVGLNKEDDDDQAFEEDIFGNHKKKKKIKKKKSRYDSPFEIASLKPIQMPNLDLDEIKDSRSSFTKDEWIALMLRSAGYEPDELTQKQKLHYLLRFVPFIQKNYNLVELGPRGTGKSHAYSELSPYSILMSSGTTTVSNMFYNMASRRVGLVGNWDCIAFDEVAGITQASGDMVQIMKN